MCVVAADAELLEDLGALLADLVQGRHFREPTAQTKRFYSLCVFTRRRGPIV
eukprot:XP_001703961.1 Hypothetical protein GL50803_36882 [Giardia lamblia ATCC 50803]